MNGFVIRHAEMRHDGAVHGLLKRAFGGEAEAELVAGLRRDDDLAIALIAEADQDVIGYIACSPLVLEGSGVRGLALAPLAVAPEWQRRSVGSALIEDMKAVAMKAGYEYLLVLGDPAYYARFGFDVQAARRFTTPYDGAYMQALGLTGEGHRVSGRVAYAAAFARLGGAH